MQSIALASRRKNCSGIALRAQRNDQAQRCRHQSHAARKYFLAAADV